MNLNHWYLIIGVLFILLVITSTRVRRLPLSTAMVYLLVGALMGWLGWITLDPIGHAGWIERLSEIAVIVSLFSAGLKLRCPLRSRRWRLPVLLAFVSMAFTVGLLTLMGMYFIGLPLGAAILLGGILAPTDPVLASDVQLEHPHDPDRLRFTLTGEAGLNDGSAFPFVMLGLGLMGLHELGDGWWRWWTIDVVWAVVAGLATGSLLGMGVAHVVVYLRRIHREAVGLDDFLAIGLIALAYGVALAIHAYGFLAVFAAGLALRTVEREMSESTPAPPDVQRAAAPETAAGTDAKAIDPESAPAYMAEAVLQFNAHLERIGELAMVLITGAMLVRLSIPLFHAAVLTAVLLLIIRPIAVAPMAVLGGMNRLQTTLTSWFGVRGVGSVYYLFYAITHGVPESLANTLIPLTLSVIAVSIVVHGISVTPLMSGYERLRKKRGARRSSAPQVV